LAQRAPLALLLLPGVIWTFVSSSPRSIARTLTGRAVRPEVGRVTCQTAAGEVNVYSFPIASPG